MPKYKVLKGVAHNFGHSFISLMNYEEGDYVMGHLLKAARHSGKSELRVDVLEKNWQPPELAVPPVHASLGRYCVQFPRLVSSSGSSMELIVNTLMTIRFDLAIERP